MIISAFPCVGKTQSLTNFPEFNILDSDSSLFSWIEPGVRNPNFPENYISNIKMHVDKADFILVSSHEIVRDALIKEEIPFSLVYPSRRLKD